MPDFRCMTKSLLLTMALVCLTTTALGAEGHKKRQAPAEVPPIEINGLRYEAVHFGSPFGYAQDGGILVVRDARSGRLQWTQRIYTVDKVDSIEGDKQDVFIASMKLSHDGKHLLMTDARGLCFDLNLTDRSVTKLNNAACTTERLQAK